MKLATLCFSFKPSFKFYQRIFNCLGGCHPIALAIRLARVCLPEVARADCGNVATPWPALPVTVNAIKGQADDMALQNQSEAGGYFAERQHGAILTARSGKRNGPLVLQYAGGNHGF